ncbi:MAG: DUF1295 domain-containing protein [Clostridia bacterium]|nr:DUF1295 domain-containing protein [Clostridia bacterium]
MLKLNRTLCYFLLTFIYTIATTLGILIYIALPYDLWLKLLISDVCATASVFIFSQALDNSSVYDPYWSVAPMVILTAFCFGTELNPVKLALFIPIMIWGTRLTLNFAYTFVGFSYQDWRYVMLKEKTGKFYPLINFLGIHLFPTLVVYLCIMPAALVITSDSEGSPLSVVFSVLILFAVLLQGIADFQMHKYRRNKTTTFIRVGLWKHSRHPNYLGEILVWWLTALAAAAYLGFTWWLFLGAIVNNLMFLFVSIPMADKRQSAKPGFDEYKRATRGLLPLKFGKDV